ncbi:hypothetical protein KP509_25G057400 [Ceratopteris richardii]|uniref:J domain-containing protein n=1 Tax=Ceratopteris richardii TaxID=49495 RepID=A0A8T2RQN9_CERRI|nr:hypothetical protein KP509_25G057400 [Ceratopteris richardii]
MECNRDEAARVKGLAEQSLALKEYAAAKKYALKAQQLYPSIENMAQMMTVIDVHMSALHRVPGCNELDWYGILKLDPNADEAAIKKQYRRLALLLHPDKNKLEGAESAFKLVGEASQFLSDKAKRLVYDAKRGLAQRKPLSPSRAHNVKKPFPSQRTSVGKASAQPASEVHPDAFWTYCPFCQMRYQYLRKFEDKKLVCINCQKPFVAVDLKRMYPNQFPFPNTGNPTYFNPSEGFRNSANLHEERMRTSNTAMPDPAANVVFGNDQSSERARTSQKEKLGEDFSGKSENFHPSKEKQVKDDGVKVTQKGQDGKPADEVADEVLGSMESQRKQQPMPGKAKDEQEEEDRRELYRRAKEVLEAMKADREQQTKQNGAKLPEKKPSLKKVDEFFKHVGLDKGQHTMQNGTNVQKKGLRRKAQDFIQSMETERNRAKQKKESLKQANITRYVVTGLKTN